MTGTSSVKMVAVAGLNKMTKADIIAHVEASPPAPPPPPPVSKFKQRLTVALGCFIPLASLAMSKVSGTLASEGYYGLAGFAAAVGLAVLVVSLEHLAWAIHDITGSGRKQSWLLAVALDCGIVLTELVSVFAADCGLAWVCWLFLAAVIGFSMVLNCYAFLNHKRAK